MTLETRDAQGNAYRSITGSEKLSAVWLQVMWVYFLRG